jgi:hypothetical protein
MRAGIVVFVMSIFAVAAGVASAALPTATTGTATQVTATSATLNGTVARNGEATTYHFEYGTTTAYGSRTPDKNVAGNQPRDVSEDVAGLQPSTTYHFRVVAVNASGTTNGADATFTTPAAGPNDDVLTIAANPRTVTFGKATTIAGRLTGPDSAGTRVELEQNPFPFTGAFSTNSNTTTDASGNYSFQVSPPVNTRFRTTAQTPGSDPTSPELTVNVRPKVGLKLSDRTPARGKRVRFRGSVLPAHDGKSVRIQRRTKKGWRTVKTALLKPGTPVNGTARSVYSKRIRIRRSGTWRTVFRPADGDHVRGKSRRHRIRVH